MIHIEKNKILIETDMDIQEITDDKESIMKFLCFASEGMDDSPAKRKGMGAILNLMSYMEFPCYRIIEKPIDSLQKRTA